MFRGVSQGWGTRAGQRLRPSETHAAVRAPSLHDSRESALQEPVTRIACDRASGGHDTQPYRAPRRKPFKHQPYGGEVGLKPSSGQGNRAVGWTTPLTFGGLSQQRLPGLSNLTFPVWLDAPQHGTFTLEKRVLINRKSNSAAEEESATPVTLRLKKGSPDGKASGRKPWQAGQVRLLPPGCGVTRVLVGLWLRATALEDAPGADRHPPGLPARPAAPSRAPATQPWPGPNWRRGR